MRFCRVKFPALPGIADEAPALEAWEAPPADPGLQPDEVHIWTVSLDDPALDVAELTHTLSADELARTRRYRFPSDRHRFVAARGWLRSVLSRYLHQPARRLVFHYGPQGKPGLTPFSPEAVPLSFNLAHADAYAVLAIGYGRQVGVDIEQIHSISEAAAIAESFYSPREQALYRAVPEDQRDEAFFRIWTRKEAVMKAAGTGLDETLVQVEVSPEIPGPVHVPGSDLTWRITSFAPEPGYVAALAVSTHESPPPMTKSAGPKHASRTASPVKSRVPRKARIANRPG